MIRRLIVVLSFLFAAALYVLLSITLSNVIVSDKVDQVTLYFFGTFLFYPFVIFISWMLLSCFIIQPIIYILKGSQKKFIFSKSLDILWDFPEKIKNKIKLWTKCNKKHTNNFIEEEWKQYLPEVEKAIHPYERL